ncbi:MAG: peroxidase family protein [Methylococcaceae bacterium]
MNELGHGTVGKHEASFTALLPLRKHPYNPRALARLAQAMKGEADTVKDGPDPEENILVPAGYTYFGQFIDHDLTFDSTSTLNSSKGGPQPTNLRTPRLDLDCLYGDGPDAQPYMYDGVKLLYKNGHLPGEPTNVAEKDLLRNPLGRAIIGDKRNDENSIVSQIHLAFIKYHNAVVDQLKTLSPEDWNTPNKLFESAQNEVRWCYQKLITEDFLPRIISAAVLSNLQAKKPNDRACCYALYTEDKRGNLPREFVAAAYRFGHSGVRTGYRMNYVPTNRFDIFPASGDPTDLAGSESLLGFDPVPSTQVIDHWGRFFPDQAHDINFEPQEDRSQAADRTPDGNVRLQFAYKLDPTLVDPLAVLPRKEVAGEQTTQQAAAAIAPETLPDKVGEPPRPSLALLNLLRGNTYLIQGGQAIANVLIEKGLPCKILQKKHMVIRQPSEKSGDFKFLPIEPELVEDTPLWFYILAEAQAPLVEHFGDKDFNETKMLTGIGAKTQLGWVGGRIVAEVFYGLLDADMQSYVNAAPETWEPMLGGDKTVIFRNLLKFADPTNA